MKLFADKKKLDKSFAVGDWVYLRLQPYKQSSVQSKKLGKLAPHFYGPFQVLQKVGEVSYKLDLLAGSLINHVFHVSNLKAKLGTHVVPRPTLPSMTVDQILSPEPVAILATRSHQLKADLSLKCWSNGRVRARIMLLRRVCLICSKSSHTLWARCFEGEGIVRSVVCVCVVLHVDDADDGCVWC